MIFNFSAWDIEGSSANQFTHDIENARNSLESKIADGEEAAQQQTNRLIACIYRREKIANAAITVMIFNAVFLPCLVFFEHPDSAVYALCLFNGLLAAWAFYQKKSWETADLEKSSQGRDT